MSHTSKPTKPPLFLLPPFCSSQWDINKGVMIEKAATNCGTDVGMFTAGMGTIMTYNNQNNDWFVIHSRNLDGQITNDGSCYQFQGGERVILYGYVFISQVLPGQFFARSKGPLDVGWQVLVESYLLNDLEFYDLLYE